jgi:NhaP-type Na+/H+ or K+/H+ antiporter
MTRRRNRPGPGRRLLVQAVTVWLIWLGLRHVPHVSGTAAALVAGAAWGLLAGWRFRGRLERSMRRLVRRAFWRFGVRVSFPGRRRR